MKIIKAFTLAEVLIALAIIGIVAAITIPSVTNNYRTKQYESTKKVLMSNLHSATRNMQVADKLIGHATTADFVNQFKKYMKIVKICDNAHLSNCFVSDFTVEGQAVKIDEVKTSDKLGKSYSDDNIGIVMANGISAIITYDSNCTVAGMNFQQSLLCLGMMYDLNGKKGPNISSSDIGFFNASLKNYLTVQDFRDMGCSANSRIYCGYVTSMPDYEAVLEKIRQQIPINGSLYSSSNILRCDCNGGCDAEENSRVSSCEIVDSGPH